MLPTRAPKTPTIDRSACPSVRGHGTRHHRYRNGCTCVDGLRDARHRRYRQELGRKLPPRSTAAIGTARRLQALAVLGYSTIEIGAWIGLHRDEVSRIRNGRRDHVFKTTAKAVRDLAHDLHSRPRPVDPPGKASGRARARGWAAAQGWVTLAAWDDVDDPAETPDQYALRQADARLPMADVLELVAAGEHLAHVARRAGLTVDALERRVQRHRAGSDAVPEAVITAIRDEYRAIPRAGWSGKACAARHGVSTWLVSKSIHGAIRPELGLTDLTVQQGGHTPAAPPTGRENRKGTAA